MSKPTITFSIITMSYNSGEMLFRPYKSLLKQGDVSFEWIIVDDGSQDEGRTRKVISEIKKIAPFVVKSVFLDRNYFGARSMIEGCNAAAGEYLCCLDHDDQFWPNSLPLVEKYINKYVSDTNDVVGVSGRCVDENGVFIGKKFKNPVQIITEGDMRFSLKITGELWQIVKTEVVKPFYAMMEPGFTHGFVWAALSKLEYKFIYVNDVLRIYDTSFSGSYSNTGKKLLYPKAKAKLLKHMIISYRKHLRQNYLYSLKMCASYIKHCKNARISFSDAISEMDLFVKILCMAAYPFGYLRHKGLI